MQKEMARDHMITRDSKVKATQKEWVEKEISSSLHSMGTATTVEFRDTPPGIVRNSARDSKGIAKDVANQDIR